MGADLGCAERGWIERDVIERPVELVTDAAAVVPEIVRDDQPVAVDRGVQGAAKGLSAEALPVQVHRCGGAVVGDDQLVPAAVGDRIGHGEDLVVAVGH